MSLSNVTVCPMCGAAVDTLAQKCRSCGEPLSRTGAPETGAPETVVVDSDAPAISVGGTILPRYLAAGFDNLLAIILAIVASAIVSEDYPVIRVGIVVGVYLAYYLVSEGLLSATPAKLVAGLVVVQFNGQPCTWRQSIIRNLFRILEVNPLLGGLPAAVRIVLSRDRQRFGDRRAGTIVVPRRRVRLHRRTPGHGLSESNPDNFAGSGRFSDRRAWIAIGIVGTLTVLAVVVSRFHSKPVATARPVAFVPKIGQSPQPDPEIYRLYAGTEAGQIRDDNEPKMKLVWCPPGDFKMGSTNGDWLEHGADGQPVHVILTHGFWLGQFEVTQREWTAVMGTSKDEFANGSSELPAIAITHNDAVAFCMRLTKQETQAGRLPVGWRYTLPTEAQWEYACRAGTEGSYSFGDDAARLNDYGWWGAFTDAAGARDDGYSVHQVGGKLPNAWGLFDMHGNASEWSRDQFVNELPGGTDPEIISGTGVDTLMAMRMFLDESKIGEKLWVFRGGSISSNDANECRSAFRSAELPDHSSSDLGFRVAVCAGK